MENVVCVGKRGGGEAGKGWMFQLSDQHGGIARCNGRKPGSARDPDDPGFFEPLCGSRMWTGVEGDGGLAGLAYCCGQGMRGRRVPPALEDCPSLAPAPE